VIDPLVVVVMRSWSAPMSVRERRLITHRRRNAAEQRRHFGAGLGEAENVVDEEQHVLALIAEIFGDGEAGEADAGTGARRLVHLAVHQRALRFHVGIGMVRVGVDLGLDELVIEVVALAGALADAGEHRIAAMGLGDVVDELLNEHRLADAGAAEQADLAALGVGREQVHHLDAGDQDRGFGRLIGEGRCRRVNRPRLLVRNGAGLVDRLADHVHDAPERTVADRHGDRNPGVDDFLSAHQALGSVHRDRAQPSISPSCWATSSTRRLPWLVVSSALRIAGRCSPNLTSTTAPMIWVMCPTEFAISSSSCVLCVAYSASAPEMISINSLVIIACRVRL